MPLREGLLEEYTGDKNDIRYYSKLKLAQEFFLLIFGVFILREGAFLVGLEKLVLKRAGIGMTGTNDD